MLRTILYEYFIVFFYLKFEYSEHSYIYLFVCMHLLCADTFRLIQIQRGTVRVQRWEG